MGESLVRYLRIKIPQIVRDTEPNEIQILPDFRIDARLNYPAKIDKRFNYIRPGVKWKGSATLQCYCFPGAYYAYHFGSIYRSFFSLSGFAGTVSLAGDVATQDQIASLLLATGLAYFPRNLDVVIVGNVDRLPVLLSSSRWIRAGLFEWKIGKLGSKRVGLLGCHHTLWGDISFSLMQLLAEFGVEYVVYTGKLGSLDPVDEPNVTLATGDASWLVDGELISWQNVFGGLNSETVQYGTHTTIRSLLEETTDWLHLERSRARFVDPEIGCMAAGAASASIHFSYLHVISDNVSRQRAVNLSNERLAQVIRQRKFAFAAIDEMLTHRLRAL